MGLEDQYFHFQLDRDQRVYCNLSELRSVEPAPAAPTEQIAFRVWRFRGIAMARVEPAEWQPHSAGDAGARSLRE